VNVWNVETCGVRTYVPQNARSLLLDGLGIITNALCGVWCVVCAPVPAPGPSSPPPSGMRAGFLSFLFYFIFLCHALFMSPHISRGVDRPATEVAELVVVSSQKT
jgi:hypothetical protein